MEERRIDWKAVLVGALTDTMGTLTFVSLVGLAAAFVADLQHVPISEMEARLQRPASMTAMMIIGLAFTVLGGFIAGRMAGKREILHGALVGCVGIIVGLIVPRSALAWYDLLSLVVMVPGGMLGGRIAKKD